jgi:hypothetical protein
LMLLRHMSLRISTKRSAWSKQKRPRPNDQIVDKQKLKQRQEVPVCAWGSLINKRYRRLFPNFFNGCYLNTFGELMLTAGATPMLQFVGMSRPLSSSRTVVRSG